MALELMMITNDVLVAREAENAGVNRIFIDMETLGKEERQGHLDTVKSNHSFEDIKNVRRVVNASELMVRVNPMNCESKGEIEKVISCGADIIMLPMFKSAKEVRKFVDIVDKRTKICLLLETSEALVRIDEILEIEGIDEIHIGLNDLHLSLGVDFMFETLSGGIVEYLLCKVRKKGIKCGFGGIAKLGNGDLSAEKIIAEHYRLGSKMVILSRSFYNSKNDDDVSVFKEEIEKIRKYERSLVSWSEAEFEKNRLELVDIVRGIVKRRRECSGN
ncbi:MAG: HpcH/HpaI aldolase/citrate lyase family protein [Firmicutes bacterium]|nr:HpcH/HpaI aldolase/citrate lyase family protein [Bacillota bacterium]